MFHLLFALQEIATYHNAVKCSKSLDGYEFKDDYLLYNKCDEGVYCFGECNATACADSTQQATVDATKDTFFPVEGQFIISFANPINAKNVINAIDVDDVCGRDDLILNGAVGEKKTFYLITCIMFWVAFLLIVGTFVLALISIANCGCCRCCNSVKSIFPMKSTVGSA